MRQKATVVSTDGKKAVVKVERASMCDGCHKKGCADGCSMYSIFGGDKNFSAVADNSFGATEGSVVFIETSDNKVLLSAFVVFMLPLILSFGCYFIIKNFFTEEQSLIIALSLFALYFVILSIVEKAKKKKNPELKIVSYANERDA